MNQINYRNAEQNYLQIHHHKIRQHAQIPLNNNAPLEVVQWFNATFGRLKDRHYCAGKKLSRKSATN